MNGNQRIRFTALRPQFEPEESVLKPFLKSIEFCDFFFGSLWNWKQLSVEFWWKHLKKSGFYIEKPSSPPNYDVCFWIDSIFTAIDTKWNGSNCGHIIRVVCCFLQFYQKISLLATWNVKKIYRKLFWIFHIIFFFLVYCLLICFGFWKWFKYINEFLESGKKTIRIWKADLKFFILL